MKRLIFAFMILSLLAHGGCADGKSALNMHSESDDLPESHDYLSRELPNSFDEGAREGFWYVLDKIPFVPAETIRVIAEQGIPETLPWGTDPIWDDMGEAWIADGAEGLADGIGILGGGGVPLVVLEVLNEALDWVNIANSYVEKFPLHSDSSSSPSSDESSSDDSLSGDEGPISFEPVKVELESDGKPSFLMEPINNLSARRGDMLEDDAWPEWPHSSEAGDAVGVDVSDYQGTIDWSKVAGAGYSFAFIKATEGEGWKGDAKARQQNFRTNMQGASSAGMLVGAYHFARPDLGNSAEDEARWFVDVAGDYIKPGYLRPVLDIEIGSADLSSWVNEWIETVTSETGVEPLIYTNAYYSSNYLDNSVKRYDLWISHWTYDPTRSPNTGIWDSWAFWQYSDMGEVPGIAGDVDLNIFRGSESELSYYVISASSTGADFPNVYEFQVTQLGIILGDFFTIDYTVSDNSGPGLKQVELWCKDETSDWQEIDRNNLAGESGPITGSFTDSPPAPGTYWYGVHVVDNAGNWNDERNSNTNYQPVSFEPVEVEVIDSSSAQGSTNCDSAEAKSWFERGVAFYDQFDYTEAIDCFDEATKICPQYEAAWGKMGDAYLIGRFGFFSDNNPNEAIRCYDEALKINPRNATVWNNKGTAYNDLGQYDEAIQCYDEALIINPEYAEAWYGKGHSQYNQGNHGDALQSIEMAITFNPEIPPFWQEKGVILEALGYEGAQAAFDKADELKKIHKPIRKTEGAVEYD